MIDPPPRYDLYFRKAIEDGLFIFRDGEGERVNELKAGEVGKVSYFDGHDWSTAYLNELDGYAASGVDKHTNAAVRLQWNDESGIWEVRQ